MISQASQIFQNLFPAPLLPIIRNVLQSDHFSGSVVRLLENVPSNQALMVLHPDEFSKWSGYRFPKRSNEFLTGRLAAKVALHSKHLLEPDKLPSCPEICIANHEGGQPYISTPESLRNLEISISHSGLFGAALVAPVTCGIDIQESEDRLVNLQSHYTFPGEVIMLQQLLPRTSLVDLLNLLWTAREAIRKATSKVGMPGFLAMQLADASVLANGVSMLKFRIDNNAALHGIATYTILLGGSPNYALAVAFNNGDCHA